MIRVCCARNSCRFWSDSSGVSCALYEIQADPAERRSAEPSDSGISDSGHYGMKLISIIAAVAGVAVAALLVAWFGVGAVLHAIREVGIVGFAAICALHLGLIIPLGASLESAAA